MRQRRPLVNRQGNSDLDRIDNDEDDDFSVDYVTLDVIGSGGEDRIIPLIPFDELMLIETLGMGRVSTIYRAAWRRSTNDQVASKQITHMVALKVAMVTTTTLDTSHVDELRREADIAARLQHPNICDLIGVAADSE
jgi:serine/threonine protein kinase